MRLSMTMRAALGRSLDQAALVYLRYHWEQRARLKVLHPWAQAAYVELRELSIFNF